VFRGGCTVPELFPKCTKNCEDFKADFWRSFFEFWKDFGVENGGKIIENLSERRSGNEKCDSMKNAIPPMK
jgi:hypothetical protein